MRVFWLGGLTLLVVSCRPQHDDPLVAYGAFSTAVKRHDTDTAFKALSTPTQKAIEERMKSISEAACPPGALQADKEKKDKDEKEKPRCAVKTDAALMFFASGVKVQELGKMTVLEKSDEAAVIEVGEDGGSYRQKMVKEGTGWRVDLTETLR